MNASKIDRFEMTKTFEKTFAKLTAGEQRRIQTALRTATIDLDDPMLRRHELKGTRAGTISLSAGGDLRILCRVYQQGKETVALLQVVGTHSQLYG